MTEERPAMMLLSGGLDSCVAFYWAMDNYKLVHAITFDYGQVAQRELHAARAVWEQAKATGYHKIMHGCNMLFVSESSILGRVPIDHYQSTEEAIARTPSDKSYIPLRNAVLLTIAGHHLLTRHPGGGDLIIGTRGRAGGFPDCTTEFAMSVGVMLSMGTGEEVYVLDPLQQLAPSRTLTVKLASELPGCMEAVAHTVTCFEGSKPPCGTCLPCIRRAQGFAEAGLKDPAL